MTKTKRRKNTSLKESDYSQAITIDIICVIAITISLIAIFEAGVLGKYLSRLVMFLFGRIYLGIFILIILMGVWVLFRSRVPKLSWRIRIGIMLLVAAILILCALPKDLSVGQSAYISFIDKTSEIFSGGNVDSQGGWIGALLYYLTSTLAAYQGSWIIAIALILVSVILLVDRKYFALFREKIQGFGHKAKDKVTQTVSKFPSKPEPKEPVIDIVNDQKPQLITIDQPKPVEDTPITFINLPNDDNSSQGSYVLSENESKRTVKKVKDASYSDYLNYKLPNIGKMLEQVTSKHNNINEKVAKEKGQRLIEVLGQFSIPAELIDTYIGPSVTKFVIRPEASINVNRIVNIQDNIKMELAAKSIRIEAPIPGMRGVGIEIPNVQTTPVRMRDILQRLPAKLEDVKLLVVLGKDLFDNPVFCDLDKMPHLLVAGATGSGKSVCMNAIICSLLLRDNPAELKLCLIDPKKVEFTRYQNIPHLICPVIDDAKKAARVLQAVVKKMEGRYDVFAKAGVTNLKEYNEYLAAHPEFNLRPMPYIVVIIDELADLMAVAGKEVETSIQRITQLARAAGIHLVVATQRPSTDVITGLIKANIPSRISFAVTNGIDSRVILDQTGAENLLGNGDMLYKPQGVSHKRLQGVFVTNKEIENITSYVSSEAKPFYEDDIYSAAITMTDSQGDGYTDPQDEDPMYSEVVKFVIAGQKASTSLIQRKFGLGYNRAARIVDMMEQKGVVGPANGSKPREVFIKAEAGNEKNN